MLLRRSPAGRSSETTMYILPPATVKKGIRTAINLSQKRFSYVVAALIVAALFFFFSPLKAGSAPFGSSSSGSFGDSIGLRGSSQQAFFNEQRIRRRSFRRSADDLCWSRSELYEYGYLNRLHSTDLFKSRLAEYSKHHGSCMAVVKNWTSAYLGEEKVFYSTKKGKKVWCDFLILHGSSQGLGNRLQAMVAAFSYGLHTNRVLVIMDWIASTLICLPFSNEGFYMDWKMVDFVIKKAKINSLDLSLSEDLWKAKVKEIGQNGKVVSGHVEVHLRNSVEVQNFFCEAVQERVKSITFLVISSEQYFLPGFYLVPSLRKDLEALFPDLNPFTHLSRYLLLPSNVAWERITRMYSMHFIGTDRKIGIQVRTFVQEDTFAHDKILDCLVNISRVLPHPVPVSNWTDEVMEGKGSPKVKEIAKKIITDPNPEKVMVFITSLHEHHASFLRQAYTDGVSEDGTMVKVHSFSGEGTESHDLLLDQRAFTEIWLVAMCDSILSSHFSTFGYCAAGLSGKSPFLLNVIPRHGETVAASFEDNGRPVCEQSYSADACFHAAPIDRQCNFTGPATSEMEVPSYIQPCQDASFGYRIDSRKV